MKKIKELTLPNFKTCYKATEIKAMWHWQKSKQTNGTGQKVQKQVYTNIIHSSLTEMQRQFTEERTIFPTNTAETTGHPHAKKYYKHRFYILHNNELRLDLRMFKCKMQNS